MAFIENNITLINPFVWEGYFHRQTNGNDAHAFVQGYLDFINEHKEKIQALNESMLHGTVNMLNESYGFSQEVLAKANTYAARLQALNEWVKPDSVKNALNAETYEDSEDDPFTDSDVYHVYNYDKGAQSIKDIHFFVEGIYDELKRDGSNFDKYSALSLMDTSKVKEMDALFAFKNIPNMRFEPRLEGLNVWDTSNVINMTGMFYRSTFNNDSIAFWNVTNVLKMDKMFFGCPLSDSQVISDWNPKCGRPSLGFDVAAGKDYSGDFRKELSKNVNKMKKLNSIKESINATRLMSFDEYVESVNEGRFLDKMKSVAGKVVGSIKGIIGRMKNGLAAVVVDGKAFIATTLEFLSNNANKVRGVQVSVGGADDITLPEGTYGFVDENDPDYDTIMKNLKTLYSMGGVNEDKIPLSGESMKNSVDATFSQAQHHVVTALKSLQQNKQRPKTLLFWGAPGVGKSSVAEVVIDALNSMPGEKERYGLISINCAELPVDGLFMPTIPKADSAIKYLKKDGSEGFVPNYEASEAKNPVLPMYCMPSTVNMPVDEIRRIRKVLDDATNTSSYNQPVYDEETGETIEHQDIETTGGGILLLDELLRANPALFPQLMELVNVGKMGKWQMGSKWIIVACSNRPVDDQSVEDRNATAAPAFYDRFRQFHLTPSFNEWKKFMMGQKAKLSLDGLFKGSSDSADVGEKSLITLMFKYIEQTDAMGENSKWHHLESERVDKNGRADTKGVTPRTWTKMCKDVSNYLKLAGVSFGDFLKKKNIDTNVYNTIADTIKTDVGNDFLRFCEDNYVEDNSVSVFDMISGKGKISADAKKGKKAATAFNECTQSLTTGLLNNFDSSRTLSDDNAAAIMKWFWTNFKSYIKMNIPIFITDVYCRLVSFLVKQAGVQTPKDIETPMLDDVFENIQKQFPGGWIESFIGETTYKGILDKYDGDERTDKIFDAYCDKLIELCDYKSRFRI